MQEHFVDKKTEKLIAAKMDEAVGLLTLVKPLSKRAGKLTAAEQEMLLETISKASTLLCDASTLKWDAREKATSNTAVRMGAAAPSLWPSNGKPEEES